MIVWLQTAHGLFHVGALVWITLVGVKAHADNIEPTWKASP